MFGPNHYVPVLKVKRGEKAALQSLAPAIAGHVTPLLEIVEMNGEKTLSEHLDTAFQNLALAIAGLGRIFIDTREIAEAGPVAAQTVFARATQLGLRFTPVTGPSRTVDVQAALSTSPAHGLALRVTRSEYEAGMLPNALTTFLHLHQLSERAIDLIVDLEAVDQMVPAGVAYMLEQIMLAIPNGTAWRSFSVIASAFPKSMGVAQRNTWVMVDRSEWIAWRDYAHSRRGQLPRLPTFGDCAIQHPAGVEGFDPRFMSVSAAIRYALGDAWLLIKGQSTDAVPAVVQFPSLAAVLVTGSLSQHFLGAAHCRGCADMARASSGVPRLGSPEVWRRLGTIHHITRTVEAIQQLSWP